MDIVLDKDGNPVCFANWKRVAQGKHPFLNEDGSEYHFSGSPGGVFNGSAVSLANYKKQNNSTRKRRGGKKSTIFITSDDGDGDEDDGDLDDEFDDEKYLKRKQKQRERKGGNKTRTRTRKKGKEAEEVMGYKLEDEPRDKGKRERVDKMVEDGKKRGYIYYDCNDMSERELDADYERKTGTSLSQENTGKNMVKCGQCGVGEYERRKGGGHCKECGVMVKESRAVYLCSKAACDEQRCLKCFNELRNGRSTTTISSM